MAFHLASGGIRCMESPISLLVNGGWQVPDSGECKLFFRANNLGVVEEFHTLVAGALVRNPAEAALDIVADVDWAAFNVEMVASEQVHRQKGPTCWAHALGTVLHLAGGRIVGRANPSFETIRGALFSKYGQEKGQPTMDVLQNEISAYRLGAKYNISESEARQAVIRHRPVLATFKLKDGEKEWDKFSACGRNDPLKTMTEEDVLDDSATEALGGHAVVLVDVAPGRLTFHNSWGADWGDNGRFHIRDASVLRNMRFHDVFFTIPMLNDHEKNAWTIHERSLRENLEREYPALARFFRDRGS